MSTNPPRARCIAVHLPQFYPMPENEEWWGPGYTEWTLVRNAQPMFNGHNQPRSPHPMIGYYNQLDPSCRIKQAQLAQDHGIEGFCHWHFWFGNGRVLMDSVVSDIVRSGIPSTPFCLGWANHSWTRTKPGSIRREMQMEQLYPGEEDHRRHFEHLLPILKDPRYMTVDGKPIFVLYNTFDIPKPQSFINLWNDCARANGLPGMFFIGMARGWSTHPTNTTIDGVMGNQPSTDFVRYIRSCLHKAVRGNITPVLRCARGLLHQPKRFSFEEIAEATMQYPLKPNEFPHILTNWDNTPRHGKKGTVFTGGTPEIFQRVLSQAIERLQDRPLERRLVFLKSWNEWSEGNYIEPDTEHGMRYLEIIRQELCRA